MFFRSLLMSNKKALAALVIILMIPAAVFSATGLGAAFTYSLANEDYHAGGALSLNTPVIPGTVQNISLSFNPNFFSFSLSDDWWVIRENIGNTMDLYIGLGFYAGIARTEAEDDEGESNTDFSLGARAPVGLTMMPIDFIELFFEVAPAMGLGFEPEIYFPSWYVQGALGFRLWF